MTTKMPSPALEPGTLYLAYDRFVCSMLRCAGSSALYTGITIGGAVVDPMTRADLAEWQRLTGEPVARCQCGTLEVPCHEDGPGQRLPR